MGRGSIWQTILLQILRRLCAAGPSVDGRSLAVDVAKVWHSDGISLPSHLALKLLIATGQRVEEVLQSNWREFDLAEKVWTIPAERRKNRHNVVEPHIIPLTDFHIELLEQARDTTAHHEWLFPHKNRNQPRKADALYQAVYRFCRSNNIDPFAPRDCRRISHWSVNSEAAVAITTGMLDEMADNREIGRAEALRRSMLAMMETEGKDLFAHPMFWAPFVVVGERRRLSAAFEPHSADGPFHLSPVVFNGDTDEGHDGDRAVALGSATKL